MLRRLSVLGLSCALATFACTEDPDDEGGGGAGGVIIDADATVDEDASGGQVIIGDGDGGGGGEMAWCTPSEFEDQVVAYCEAQFSPGRLGANCNADAQCDSGYCYADAICAIRCDGDRPACPRESMCSPAFDGTETSGCVSNDGIECEHFSGSLTDCVRNVNQQLESVCAAGADEGCDASARTYLTCLGGLGQVCPESRFEDCAIELVRVESCCDGNCQGPW